MAASINIEDSEYDWERKAQAELANLLSNEWLLLNNIPKTVCGQEIDTLLIGHRAAIVIELKSKRGKHFKATLTGAWIVDDEEWVEGERLKKINPITQSGTASQKLKTLFQERFPEFIPAPSFDSCGILSTKGALEFDTGTEARACLIGDAVDLIERRIAIGKRVARLSRADQEKQTDYGPRPLSIDQISNILHMLGENIDSENHLRFPDYKEWLTLSRSNAKNHKKPNPGAQPVKPILESQPVRQTQGARLADKTDSAQRQAEADRAAAIARAEKAERDRKKAEDAAAWHAKQAEEARKRAEDERRKAEEEARKRARLRVVTVAACLTAAVLGLVAWGYRDQIRNFSAGAPFGTATGDGPGDAVPATPATYATSFDCGRAASWAEQRVCGDAALADADRRMGALYASVIGRADGASADVLRQGQRRWIARRDGCGEAEAPMTCLHQVYSEREADLAAWTPPPPPPSAPTYADDSPRATPAAPRILQGRASLTAVNRLTIDGRSVRLAGIRSGGVGFSALNALIRSGQPVHCSHVSGDAYRCVTSNGDDVAEVAVLNGLARASGPDYQDVEYTARETNAGLWGDSSQ